MTKKRLLIVADTFYPKVDGILKFIEEFSRRSKEDFYLHYLVPDLGEQTSEIPLHKITFVKVSTLISLSGYKSMRFSRSNLLNIKNAIKESDVVFIQGPALISYLSIYYARHYQKKAIFYHHIFLWELFEKFAPPILHKSLNFIIRKISIFLYNRCDEILVPYHELVRELEMLGVNRKIVVARLGVDIELFYPSLNKRLDKQRLKLDHHKKIIGYVGRISKEKNIDLLIAAFKKLRHKEDYQLLLVGGGSPEKEEEIRQDVKNCTITGFVNNVHEYLRGMDIFIMPSLTETTSLATLEAMATGLPVIATKVGFIKNYIIKDHNGLFFPKNNPSVLAVKMEKLLASHDLRENLGKNARKTVAYSFSWERSINRIKRILQGSLESEK